MKPDVIVVISYPGHCVSTVLTIKNLINITGWTDVPVTILVDDLCGPYLHYNGDYINDIIPFYVEHIPQKFTIVPFSNGHTLIPDTHLKRMGGWHRQQFIKLMLNRFMPLEYSRYYVTDGDVLQHAPLEYGKTPVNFVNSDLADTHNKFKQFITTMLGIQNVELYGKYDNEEEIREAFTHFAPFRWVEREHLSKLSKHVSNTQGVVYPLQLYKLMHEGRFGDVYKVTEWDLIEVFKTKYLDIQNDLQYWPVCDKLTDTKTGFWTFYGTDKQVDNTILDKYNITVPTVLQNKLKNISYIM